MKRKISNTAMAGKITAKRNTGDAVEPLPYLKMKPKAKPAKVVPKTSPASAKRGSDKGYRVIQSAPQSVPTAPVKKPKSPSVPAPNDTDKGQVRQKPELPVQTLKPKPKVSAYEQAAEEVRADLKAGGRVMRDKDGQPVTDRLSTRDLKYKSNGGASRDEIMSILREWGVVISQGPRKAHLIAPEYQYKIEPKRIKSGEVYVRTPEKIKAGNKSVG